MSSQQKIITLWVLLLFGMVFHVQLGLMPTFYGQNVTIPGAHGVAPQQDLWLMLGFYILPMLAIVGTLLTQAKSFRIAHFGLTIFYSVMNLLHIGFDLMVSPVEWYQILLMMNVFLDGIILNFVAFYWLQEAYASTLTKDQLSSK